MKPPVKIDDLMEEWSKDCFYNETNPDVESSKIPILHAKFEYYSGDLNNPEDLEHYGFEPMTKHLLKSNIPTYIDSDQDINNILLQRIIHQEIVDFCNSVLKELNSRTYQIGNIIKWKQISDGK